MSMPITREQIEALREQAHSEPRYGTFDSIDVESVCAVALRGLDLRDAVLRRCDQWPLIAAGDLRAVVEGVGE